MVLTEARVLTRGVLLLLYLWRWWWCVVFVSRFVCGESAVLFGDALVSQPALPEEQRLLSQWWRATCRLSVLRIDAARRFASDFARDCCSADPNVEPEDSL